MKLQRPMMVLTTINLLLLLATATLSRSTVAQEDVASVLRVRALELVDERGRVRSRLGVEPDGEVVFRLVDESGAIRVKLGASEDGSGLLLLDEETEPGVRILARRVARPTRPDTTGITLRGAGDRERVITP
jgi:hypothetical protein